MRIVDFDLASPAPSGDAEFDVLMRADLAGIVRVAEDLLRSPIAQVPASVDLTAELCRVLPARLAANMARAREGLSAGSHPP